MVWPCVARVDGASILFIACVMFAAAVQAAVSTATEPSSQTLESTPLRKRDGISETKFIPVEPSHSGVDFVVEWTPRQKVSIHGINSAGACGGVAIGDFDADGLPDLFLTRPFGGNRLYRNLGDLKFKDVTRDAGLRLELEYDAWGSGPTFVDIDNDSDLDLYVCSHLHSNRLYVNQGDGTFVERAKELGLDFSGASVTMAFADYDLDGDLDAYLVTNWLVPEDEEELSSYQSFWEFRDGRIRISPEHQEQVDVLKLPTGRLKVVQGAQLDHFYRNENGKFVDATREALGEYSASENSHGLAARWFDYNSDGYPDLYVSNDYYGPDQLFRNNRDGTMTDIAKTALPHTPWYSMGSDAADVNNDGRMDLLAADMAFTTHYKFHMSRGRVTEEGWFVDLSNPRQQVTNTLFVNTGTDRFVEAAALAGLANSNWTWAVKFGDLDNDGLVDVYVTNGVPRNWTDSDAPAQLHVKGVADRRFVEKWEKFWEHEPPLKEKNLAFRNFGDLRFEEVGRNWGLDFEGVSFGSSLGDLDGDGDLDAVTVNYEDQVRIYENKGGNNHVVTITLRGSRSNRYGVGAVVTVETDGGPQQMRDLPSVRGFMSADDPTVHFGLGKNDSIRRITIRWPDGATEEFRDLLADRHYVITESPRGHTNIEPSGNVPPMFVPAEDAPTVLHQEVPYDDFAQELLLPKRLSQLGPGIACGDINGDRLDDFYLAGAKGMTGKLLLGNGASFTVEADSDKLFRVNRSSEELAPLFFDADADGDLDLYVVNGGVENQAGGDSFEDVFLYDSSTRSDADGTQDRLYINSGAGNFVPAEPDAIPDMRFSGGAVAAADFDRDGDLDLFVGGRNVPGNYPQTPRSALLRNDDGQFVDITEGLAPGLEHAGMITSAVWSDADGDGWIDLLATCEWGPIHLWKNVQGHLADATAKAGLSQRTGWWNGIAAGDLDKDGDMDYVVSNFGVNTKYEASERYPATLYFGDFDDDGKNEIVEAEYEAGQLYAVRDRTALVNAMPIFAEAWTTFRQFAKSTLVELFGESKVESAKKFEATTLESGVLLNDGTGRFTFRPLPRMAQVSPGFAPAILDVDGDGNNDIYLVQNFYNWQRDTVRMDGGVSQLLLGNGAGDFRPVPACESGLVVAGNARAASVCDLNRDNRPDLLVAVNDGPLLAFLNQSGQDSQRLAIRLLGRKGNPTAIGARVDVELDDGSSRSAEIACGGGYLSQSTATWLLGLGDSRTAKQINVRWPNGQQSSHPADPTVRLIELQQPLK